MMNTKKRRFVIAVILMIGIMVLTGCSSAEKEELRLGLVSPLTGSGAAYGETQQNAVLLAVKEINDEGGIGGNIPVVLFSEDDEGTPSKSVTVTQKLINQDDIHVMIGALHSTCTIADMKVTEKAGIPQVAPSSTSLSITEQGNQWIFRNAASDRLQTAQLFEYATKELNLKKPAILYEASDYGTGGFNLLKAVAEEQGVEVVAVESFNTGDKDFSVQLTKIKNLDADVLFVWGYYSEGALIARQAEQMGLNIQMMGGTGFASPKFIELGGESTNDFIFSTPFIPSNPDPKVQEFVKKYEEAYGSIPDMNASQAYDATYIIKEAVERAGLDSEKIRDEIRATDKYPGVSGTTSFDENGEVIKNILIVKIENGAYEILK